MARFSRIQVALEMHDKGIVPVFYHKDIEVAKEVAKACYNAGLRVFEFTNRGDMAHEVFKELIEYANKELPEMMLGVGSIIDAPTAAIYIQMGACFVVSPILNPEVGKVCNRRKVLWSPGCGSVSEISYAEELGAEIVKIFPGAQVGGPKFVAGVRGPMPWTNIMPTGGVDPSEENLKAWFEAGVYCVGMGSNLITKELVSAKEYNKITENIKKALEVIKKVRR